MKRRPAGRRFCGARPVPTARHDQTVGNIGGAEYVRQEPSFPRRYATATATSTTIPSSTPASVSSQAAPRVSPVAPPSRASSQ